MTSYRKDPDARLDYGQDWAPPLSSANPKGPWLANGEQITAHEIDVTPTGLTLVSHAHTTSKVIIWVAGGLVGTTYRVTYRITTDQGRTDDRTDTITIRER